MKRIYTLCMMMLPFLLAAQDYETPGTAMTIDLDYLVENSEGYVIQGDGFYQITDSITISAGDTLVIDGDIEVRLDSNVTVFVEGGFVTGGGAVFTNTDDDFYRGFWFYSDSYISLHNTTFEYGGGLRAVTENFEMDSCTVQYNANLASTGAALGLSGGAPYITNSSFIENAAPAIGSGANSIVAPRIINCFIQGNNTNNENRPQINISPSGAADTTFILSSSIIGNPELDRAGGISYADLLSAGTGNLVVEDCNITDNRYGIYVYGNDMHARIINNNVIDNNNETNPMAGGSGILIQGNENIDAYISENYISGNLWGVNLMGAPTANLGDTASASYNPGGNVFENNSHDGVTYTLYNNTANDISAMNNCWNGEEELSLEDAEELIMHNADDATLGVVTFDPLGCTTSTSVRETGENVLSTTYPNPAINNLTVEVTSNTLVETVQIFDLSGRKISDKQVQPSAGIFTIAVNDLASGIYIITFNDKISTSQKFVKQ